MMDRGAVYPPGTIQHSIRSRMQLISYI
uniref:Uncharacterized protein n=1 Tax=Anguilla anguilla TaxID=7936 RepID=A0A0E9UNG4_ANGAN